MIDIFQALQQSESQRQKIIDDQLDALSPELKKYFSKKATVFGHACWIYFLGSKISHINFDKAAFLKDKNYPLIYVISNDFNNLQVKEDTADKYLSKINFGGVKAKPDWFQILIDGNDASRKKAKHIALNGLVEYNKGVVTKEGKELVSLLENKSTFLGFIPHVSYVKVRSSAKDELDSIWVHPCGQRTMLYKIKSSPILVIVNSSLELDDSALAKIKGNENNPRLKKGTIGGITG